MNIIKLHRFFVTESISYMEGVKYTYYDYLRAYVRFMYFSLKG